MALHIPCNVEFLDFSGIEDKLERERIRAILNNINSNVQLPWKIFSNIEEKDNNFQIYNNKRKYKASNNHQNKKTNSSQVPIFSQSNSEHLNVSSRRPINNVAKMNNQVNTCDGHHQNSSVHRKKFVSIPLTNAPVQFNNSQVNNSSPKCQSPTLQQSQVDPSNKVHNYNTLQNCNKSWASLFSNSKSQVEELKVNGESPVKSAVINHNNNEKLCSNKYPQETQCVNPDSYSIGEYLINYKVDSKTISLQPRGLINKRFYCYINSILQALLACPPFYNLLIGLSKYNSNNEQKPTPIIDGMCRFVKEFQLLPAELRVNRRHDKNMKNEQNFLINYDQAFEPSWTHKFLLRSDSFLFEYVQEDAEEFLCCLLNGLNDEMLDIIKLIKNECCNDNIYLNDNSDQTNDKEWQIMGPKNKGSITRRTDFIRTPISAIFRGFLKSRIHKNGDQSTDNIQPFFTLQLNIEKVKSVEEALEALVLKNQLEGVTSSKTNEKVEAWQQVTLEELPIILVLHLKCFDFKLGGCVKIVKALEFPIDLKIDTKLLSSKPSSSKERQYKLFAVVYHDGEEATRGHYITDAFHVGYCSWIRYDDASVKTVQEDQVLKPQGTRVPYLLFYRRSDTIRNK